MTHILMAVTTAPIGNSSSVKGGIAVVTLGNAQGRGTITVTAGQVTVLKHTITVSNEGGSTASGTLDGMIQANADVVPGDSGRPLLGMSTCSVCTLRLRARSPVASGSAWARLAKPSMPPACPTPSHAAPSCGCRFPRSTSILLSSSRAASMHSSASGPGLDGRPMTLM